MQISGGIRFLPIFGDSGSGKTSAALEISTHLPDLLVEQLPREAIEDSKYLLDHIKILQARSGNRNVVAIIDQYEEAAAQKAAIPTSFVETLSLLDRGALRQSPTLFIWLTTSKIFQRDLAEATTRNRRILVNADFELLGLPKQEWPSVIQENFQFHNHDRSLSDYQILDVDLQEISQEEKTIGDAITATATRLGKYSKSLQDLSNYQVVMLWPVTDGLRISRVQQFTDARQGYKLDWNAWYRQLNAKDQEQLPVREYNRARLYFDMRLVPIAAADLHPLCRDLDNPNFRPGKSYLDQFKTTHFFSILAGTWNPDSFAPLRERESKRGEDAKKWYLSVTGEPTKLGRRIAKCLRDLGVSADHEQDVTSRHSRVRADVLIDRTPITPTNIIVEMKAFSPDNTMPSTICQAVQTTLKRHAQFAGFLQRQ